MKRKPLLVGLVVLGIAAALGGSYRFLARASTGNASGAVAPTDHARPLPLELNPADLFTVQARPLTETVPITGTLKAVEQTLVRAKVAGVLTQLLVREGSAVRRGQPVGLIDPAEARARLQERTAALHSAQAQLDQSQRALAHTQRLHAQQFVAQSALDQAQAAMEIALGQRDAAAAQQVLARTALADTRPVAPIEGVVAERFVQAGEKLAVDRPIVSIVNLAQLELEAPVAAEVIGRVTIGQTLDLQVEGTTELRSGRVVRIGPSTQTGTRLVPIYIALDNTPPLIRAGLFARGRLPVSHRPQTLAVPATALRETGGQTSVYVVQGAQLLERPVTLGIREDGPSGPAMVEVLTGLAQGDTLVGKPLGALPLDRPIVMTPATGH